MTDNALLEIDGLKTYFRSDAGTIRAVDDLSVKIRFGQTLGLVGESGSGKSVTSLTIMRLLPDVGARIEGGRISFLGRDLVKLPRVEMTKLRGKEIAMIFQEPGTSLNPVYRVGDQVAEAILLHEKVTRKDARSRTRQLFEEVGIPQPELSLDKFPHEMSGGQKQRVMIAMALSCNPKLLIADEPTTALDVTIQAQILDLIRKLRDERGMAVLFITHDLGVIAEIADEVAVMYRGKLVEYNSVRNIFSNPQHPYTKGLLACRPRLDTPRKRLTTVADFMETATDDEGRLVITETMLTPGRLAEIEGRGRGRLLHPPISTAIGGHPQANDAPPHVGEADPEGLCSGDSQPSYVSDNQMPLLCVQGLKVYYPIKRGLLRITRGHVKAVNGISFSVYKGQTLGLVGESGCGKTTTGRAILRLQPITEGTVLFDGVNWGDLNGRELRRQRRRMQIVFQDPYSSLNPRMTVAAMLVEAMTVHSIGDNVQNRRDRAASLLEEVGLQADYLHRYPHEFSGGQRQRLCIARSLAVEPDFLICDESVSALDVSVQAQVLNLLKDLQEKRGLTYIFISHDLSVVKFMSDMMAVMNAGEIVEFGPSDEIYSNPQNEYTRKLIAAIPQPTLEAIERRERERGAASKGRPIEKKNC
ncbi:MAG: ABC transporter ATP-binding protein [Planctomycetales bacterium]|nr:ABC transporter ATP-binding protein [Planctomycetales bacterium]